MKTESEGQDSSRVLGLWGDTSMGLGCLEHQGPWGAAEDGGGRGHPSRREGPWAWGCSRAKASFSHPKGVPDAGRKGGLRVPSGQEGETPSW